MKTLILGAGPTGLGAGYRLKELGHEDFLILEKSSHVGGLAASFKDSQGFTWDIGGHVQFSHYRYFDEVMARALGDRSGWLSHERESWVWMAERFIPYPFQNNIRHLPKDLYWKCIQGLVELYKNPGKSPANFQEWVNVTFGKGLAEVFMNPYNFKVWAHPLSTMSYQWIGERVAVTDLARILENALYEKDDLSWGPNNLFHFPKSGGTGAIWEGVADCVGRDKIHLKTAVRSVSLKSREVELDSGAKIKFENCLSTIPIDQLLAMTSDVDPAARELGSKMVYSTSNIVGVGLEGQPPETLKKKCWMYFPESNCPFYRVTVFSNYSPQNVPQPGKQWSLMAEVSESAHRKVAPESLIRDVIEGMKATKLISSTDKILSQWSYRAPHGYPTPFLGRDETLKKIHAALEPSQMYSRGRFGGWKYEVSNQDHSMMQGVEWVNRVVLGVPELTYFFPSAANSGWGSL